MQVSNKKYQIILLLIFSIAYSCKLDEKNNEKNIENSNKVEESIVIDNNNVSNPKEIDSLINNGFPYIKKEFSLNDYSSEGGIVESYSNEKGYLVKIEVTYFGHSGKSEWSYYFRNDSLFFVDKQEYRYKNPISKEKDVIIDSITRSKYFLERGSLIKWIDENKTVIDNASEKFRQEDNYLKQDIKEFRKKIKATN